MNEAQAYPAQQPQDRGFNIPPYGEVSDAWGDYLDTSEILIYIENMLKGNELDENGNWIPSKIKAQDRTGKIIEYLEGPLMHPQEIRVIMTWLKAHLNQNTFLSKISDEMINNIAFDANLKLAKVFYRLRTKLHPHIRDLLWGMMETSIFIGLNRAGDGRKGMTLEAISEGHQTIEHLQGQAQQKQADDKKVKFFGW